MRGLSDLRVLVLNGAPADPRAEADLDFLRRRTTAHTLPLPGALTLLAYVRVLKRLLFRQDDLLVLYRLPPLAVLLVALEARLGRRPTLAIHSGRRTAFGALALGLTDLRLIANVQAQPPQGERKRGRRWALPSAKGPREATLLRAVARLAGRPWPEAGQAPVRLDIGCGSQIRPGFLGIDARPTVATAAVADARSIPVGNGLADEVYASCLLEHFDDPHQVLREIHRILRPEGQAVLRLPNLGTYSSHLDTTHRFLADLALWRRILAGYFAEVRVVPVGTKYRDNPWLVRGNWVLVNVLGWYELAQGWDFICRRPKPTPSVEYTGWWEE